MHHDVAPPPRLYLDAWLATGDQEYRRVAEETLDYVLREMTHPEGGFYSSQDADSEGEEGKFFVWTPEEIRASLGDSEETRVALRCWGVEDGPNFEGKSILWVPREPSEEREADAIAKARKRLYDVREGRVHPGRDDKGLAAWNGLACRSGLFEQVKGSNDIALKEWFGVGDAPVSAMRKDG